MGCAAARERAAKTISSDDEMHSDSIRTTEHIGSPEHHLTRDVGFAAIEPAHVARWDPETRRVRMTLKQLRIAALTATFLTGTVALGYAQSSSTVGTGGSSAGGGTSSTTLGTGGSS